jgi:ATP-binding cassette subfamily F protein 3
VTRDSSDGSSVSEKLSFRVSTEDCEPELDPEPDYPGSSSASSSSPLSPRPPPFSSLYFPPNLATSTSGDTEVHVTEPDPLTLPAFAPAPPFETQPSSLSNVEAEVKAALPRDTKGESSKGVDDGEPPPPYTEGSSPLEGFTYVMAAAGGAASIITQVQQGGPAPVNNIGGIECLTIHTD